MSSQVFNILKRHEIQLKRLEESFEFNTLTKEQIADYEEKIRKAAPVVEKPKPKPVDVNRTGRFSRAYPPPTTEVPVKMSDEQKTNINEEDDKLSKLPPHLRRKMELLNKDRSKMEISEEKKESVLEKMKKNIYEEIYKNFESQIEGFKSYIESFDTGLAEKQNNYIESLKKENRDLSLELKKTKNDVSQLKDMYIMFQKEFYSMKHNMSDFKDKTEEDIVNLDGCLIENNVMLKEIVENIQTDNVMIKDAINVLSDKALGYNVFEEEEVQEQDIEESNVEIQGEEVHIQQPQEETPETQPVQEQQEETPETQQVEEETQPEEEIVETQSETVEIQQVEEETQLEETPETQQVQEQQEETTETQPEEKTETQPEETTETQQEEIPKTQQEEQNIEKANAILGENEFNIKVNYKEASQDEDKTEKLLNKPKPPGFVGKQKFGKKRRRR